MDEKNTTFIKYADELKQELLKKEVKKIIVYSDDGEKIEFVRVK